MFRIYLLLVLGITATPVFSQTLFTYGNNPVSKEEFLSAYNKNKTPVEDKETSLREYLGLYSNFKLKVKAAQDMHLDTSRQLKTDLKSFASQVAESYMNDEEKVNELIDVVIERSKKDIHIVHFYTPLPTNTGKIAISQATKAMEELAKTLRPETIDYTSAINKLSIKDVSITVKDIGYITVLLLPYEMENIVYNLNPGNSSKVYRTKNGLHIFKNAGERESMGRWKIAQILFIFPPQANPNQIKNIQYKADSVYALLKAGADFSAMAKQWSDDKLTAQDGGEMPEFGTGKFEMPFESKVLELQKDGDISTPILTSFGYHIIKRLHQTPVPPKKIEEHYRAQLKEQIEKDERLNVIKENFIKSITKKTGFKRNGVIKVTDLYKFSDSVVKNKIVNKYPINNKIIFSFTKANIKGINWLNFVKDYKLNIDVYKGENNKALFNKFISISIADYYKEHLEEYSHAFRHQLQEFKEGNMLFEIMERKIWTKASNDTSGLKKYFTVHQNNYKWVSSAKVILFNCANINIANEAIKSLKNGNNWKEITEKSGGKIQSDSNRYEIAQLQLATNETVVNGLISSPIINSGDNTTSFVQVLQLFPDKQQRNYNEAKGLVINDYQNYLEEIWILNLKKKYPVKINENIFQFLLK